MSTAVKADIDRAIAFVRSTTAGSPPRPEVDELLGALMRAKARIELLEGAIRADVVNLRDQFAAAALTAILTNENLMDRLHEAKIAVSDHAYTTADAMLRARAAEGGDR